MVKKFLQSMNDRIKRTFLIVWLGKKKKASSSCATIEFIYPINKFYIMIYITFSTS